MAIIRNLTFLITFGCLWTCHYAASLTQDTLKPGETLNSSRSLVSASGNFTLAFFVPNDGSKNSQLAILRSKKGVNHAWIANRNTPILYPSSPFLTLDSNNTLKITHQSGDPIVIYSPPQNSTSTSSVVLATLLDNRNFVLQEVKSVDG
ncbi:unnamed protein product [Prunus armeniaca]